MTAIEAAAGGVPACLTEQAVHLIARAQDVLCDVDQLVRSWKQLEGAAELLRPPGRSLSVEESDRLTEEWHDRAGVGPLMDVLMQVASVIVDATCCAAGDARPLPETNNLADAWRHARGDGR